MASILAITMPDIVDIPFIERRAGCGKALLHEDASVQMSVYRIQPGSEVAPHTHSSSHDLFFGIAGTVEICWPGGSTILGPNAFCRVPAGTRHEVRNRSESEQAFFLLAHTEYSRFDFVPSP